MCSHGIDDVIEVPQARVINLTPHVINLYDSSPPCDCTEPLISIPRSFWIARCKEKREQIGCVVIHTTGKINIPISSMQYDEIIDLPPPAPNTIYIVSQIVAQRCPERKDVFFPGSQLLDKKGNVMGCLGLSRV
jgi:hypothetical protein